MFSSSNFNFYCSILNICFCVYLSEGFSYILFIMKVMSSACWPYFLLLILDCCCFYSINSFNAMLLFLVTVLNFILPRFATDEVMKQYGMLLACYEDNGEMVNNCIFTMMHHIAGDLDKVSVLFQPAILKSFIRIMETDFRVCDVSIRFSWQA